MRNAKRLFILGIAFLLAACAGVAPESYRGQTPVLELERYFNGTIDAWGIVTDRSGMVVRRFTVVMRCRWNGNIGVFDEDFTYADGSTEKRIWTLTKSAPGQYTGTARDVVGVAMGSAAGNALNWRYVLEIEVDGRSYHVNFDDWMYQMDDEVVINRATMSKFGIRLGEITLAFRKRG